MRKLNKKHIRATLGVMSVLFLTPLAVYALMLRSAEKVNQFRPAKQNALIAENDDIPVVTQEKELKWKNTGNQPIAVKEVTVGEICDPNGEYMRVRLVPSWYDESGCVVNTTQIFFHGIMKTTAMLHCAITDLRIQKQTQWRLPMITILLSSTRRRLKTQMICIPLQRLIIMITA